MSRALLLDMDGVLADVKLSYRQCILDTAKAFGVTISGEDVVKEKMKGNANNDWVLTQRMITARGGSSTLEEVTEKFEAMYEELCKLETLIPARGLLEEMYKRCEGRVAVVTGRPRKDCDFFLERFNLTEYIAHSVCMEDGPPKPHPNSIRVACEKLNVQPSEAVMVGDTPDDIIAARDAGAVPVAVMLPDDHAHITIQNKEPQSISVVQSMLDHGAKHVIRPGLADLLDMKFEA